MYRHILIATDGSELSARAVEHGVNLASAVGAEVSFLTVTEPFHVFSLNADQIEDTRPEFKRHMEARAEHTLAAAGEVAAAAGISFDTIQRGRVAVPPAGPSATFAWAPCMRFSSSPGPTGCSTTPLFSSVRCRGPGTTISATRGPPRSALPA